MRIFLIDPPGEQRGINAGLACLSGALDRAKTDHLVLDMVNGDPGEKNLLRAVSEFKPDIFGISIKTATYISSVHIAQTLKTAYPRVPIIAGGPHATLYGEQLLREAPQIDAAVAGDAEISLPELLTAWDGRAPVPEISGLVVRDPQGARCIPHILPADLDKLAFPNFDRFEGLKPLDHHYPLVTSRGCPHGCIYCSVGKISGPKWRARSPASVVTELERARDKWGFIEFDVLDDTFTQDVDRAVEICKLIVERRLGMKWSCPNGIRADRVTAELLDCMAKAGCHTVIFGVETGNPDLFASLKKGEKLADVVQAVGLAKKAGLRVGGYFIIGLPGDSYHGTIESLEYARKIGLDWAHFNLLAPYPGTKVWDEISGKGRFLDDWRATRHFGNNPRPVFELENYSADEMVRAYRTVHVRQQLYHLVLPPGLSERERRRAIRRMRFKYDTDGWVKDITRDMGVALSVPRSLAKMGIHKGMRYFPGEKPKTPQTFVKAPMKNIRVLMLNDFGGAAGGTEKYLMDLVRELTKYNIETAWAFEKSGNWDGLDLPRFPVRGLSANAPAGETRSDIETAFGKFRPDLIHIHNVHSAPVMRLCANLAPTIRTVHDHNFTCPSMNRMYVSGENCALPAGWACIHRLMDGGCMVVGRRPLVLSSRLEQVMDGLIASRKLSRVIAASDFMAKELGANGLDPARVETIPYFVELPDRFNAPDVDKPTRIFWAGRMVMPDKGPDLFIETLRHLSSPWEAVMAGSGPAEDFVRRKAAELGLSGRIKFTGELDRKAMDQEYRRCHVVTFTSVWPEPLGLVGVEAGAFARPVVAFDVGGIREWLSDSEGGYVVPAYDCRYMARMMERLSADPESRRTMGLKHRSYTEARFNKTGHIEKLLQIYSEVIGI